MKANLKIIYEDTKGYMNHVEHVKKLYIRKIGKKNHFMIKFINDSSRSVPMNEVRLLFMIDLNTMEEYFRYEK